MNDAGMMLASGLDAVGLALLHSLWQGILIALAYLLVSVVLLRRMPAWRVRVGEFALIASLAWPALTLAWTLGAGATVLPAARDAVLTVHALLVEQGSTVESSLMQWLAQLWFAGVLLLGLRAAWHWRQLQRVINTAVPVAEPWQRRIEELCGALAIRRPVRWLESGLVETPMMLGWVKPVVLFPAGLCLRLPQDQVELLLLHELAHVRRLDGLGNALQIAVETLLFFNPAVRWMSRRVRQDRELACDLMIGDQPARRLRYAKALLALAEYRQETAGWAMAATGGVLSARIDHLLLGRTEANWLEGRRAVWAAGLLALGLLATSLGARRFAEVPIPIESVIQSSLRAAALIRGGAVEVTDWAAPRADWRLGLVPRVLPAEEESGTAALPALPDVRRATAPTIGLAVVDAPFGEPPREVVAAMVQQPAPPVSSTVTTAEVLNIRRPEYPRHARRRGLEGWVELSFVVDEAGVPRSISPRESEPAGIFDQAAKKALEQWRFDPSVAGQQRVQRFDFALSGLNEDGRRFGACVAPTGTRICRDQGSSASDAYPVTVVGMSR